MKSIKEKDMVIDELNKKIRFIKFEHDKNSKAVKILFFFFSTKSFLVRV